MDSVASHSDQDITDQDITDQDIADQDVTTDSQGEVLYQGRTKTLTRTIGVLSQRQCLTRQNCNHIPIGHLILMSLLLRRSVSVRSLRGGKLNSYFQDVVFTLSSFTETAQAGSSIKVPKQRSYSGPSPAISSSLADTPCATLGIEGLLAQLNATLGTSYTLDTPSLVSLLNECMENGGDFGTAYARLHPV